MCRSSHFSAVPHLEFLSDLLARLCRSSLGLEGDRRPIGASGGLCDGRGGLGRYRCDDDESLDGGRDAGNRCWNASDQ